MQRRDFVRAAGVLSAGIAVSAQSSNRPSWRAYELTTRIQVLRPAGITRVWLPAPLAGSVPYQKTLGTTFECRGATAKTFQAAGGLRMIVAEFPSGVKPVVTAATRVATRDWSVNLSAPGRTPRANRQELRHFLQPTRLLPTDGIVKDTANGITRGARTDLAKARAIYEWIVENTYRNPKTRGCGIGNIKFMLESRDLGGKCADLNALYVGLARAAGLPARDVYGIRVAKSELGYKSLGISSDVATKAQHCRAEVYLNDFGWVPVDPADVRKVMLEEPPGNRRPEDEMVAKARRRLFGSWEMNWMAYNFAHDVALPGSSGPQLPFLMYPQAETSDGRLDCFDPDTFQYQITARTLAS